MIPTSDLHVVETRPLVPPAVLHRELPLSDQAARTVQQARERIKAILHAGNQRLLVIVGPCSVHDVAAAREYAEGIAQAQRRHRGELEIVMRVYFEKPRTTVGWKGMINDPHLDGSYDINTGLRGPGPAAASGGDGPAGGHRGAGSGGAPVPGRSDQLDRHRCPHHREPDPPGDGLGPVDADRIQERHRRQCGHRHQRHGGRRPTPPFSGIDKEGQAAIVSTTGNPDGHLVLRGKSGTNYHAEAVEAAAALLARDGLLAV